MASRASQLHLTFLGPPEVRLGEQQVTFPTRKTLALLVYLALEAGLEFIILPFAGLSVGWHD